MWIYEASAFSLQSPAFLTYPPTEESLFPLHDIYMPRSLRIRHFGLIASNLVENNEKCPLLLLVTISKQHSTSLLIVSPLKKSAYYSSFFFAFEAALIFLDLL